MVSKTPRRFCIESFEGDFDALALRAHFEFGALPGGAYPTSEDFQNAACAVAYSDDVAGRWHLEAVRLRRGVGYGKPLDIPAVNRAVAAWLFAHRATNA